MNSPETNGSVQKQNLLKWHHYLIAVLFVLVGAAFIAIKEINISVVCTIFACVFAAAGIVSIILYCVRDVTAGYYRLDLVYGVMSLFAALIFYTKQDAVGTYFQIIAGVILFGNGMIKLQHSIDMKRIDRKMKKVTEVWLVVMIFALVGIAAGGIVVFLTPSDTRVLFIVVGLSLIVAGLSDVFTHIVFNKKLKAFRTTEESLEEPTEETAETAVSIEQSEQVQTQPDEETETEKEETVTEENDQTKDQVLFEVETPTFDGNYSEDEKDASDKQS